MFVSVTGSNPHFAPQNRPCQAFAGGGRYFVPCGELPLKIALRWGFAAKNRCAPVFLGFLPIFTQSGGVTKFYDVWHAKTTLSLIDNDTKQFIMKHRLSL